MLIIFRAVEIEKYLFYLNTDENIFCYFKSKMSWNKASIDNIFKVMPPILDYYIPSLKILQNILSVGILFAY